MGTHVRKVTLAIANEEYDWAARVAKRTGTSISSVLSLAAKEKREREERDAAQKRAWADVVEYVTAGKPFTPEELASAQRELDLVRRPRTRRR
jgi:sugar/nucleoside kinase (ribokinase family)